MVRALCAALAMCVLNAGCGSDPRPAAAPASETGTGAAAAAATPPAPVPPAPAKAEAPAARKSVTLVYGGELQGYLTPCGCSEGMIGGLARRATFLADLRQKSGGALVNVDLGNLVKEPSRQSELKFMTILEIYLLAGFDAVCLGERDLALGGGFVAGELINRREVPIVIANLKVEELADVIRPFRTIDAKGVKVFVTGLVDPELVSGMTGVACEAPRAAGMALAAQAAGHDCRVLVAHAALPEARAWARELGFFDIVVAGVGQEDPTAPEKVGGALLVAPGVWGKYGCALRLSREDGGGWTYEFIKEALGETLAANPNVVQLIKDYQGMLALEDTRIAPERKPHPRGLFTGSARCAECHAKAYKIFEKSMHAKALDTLKDIKSHVDPECLSCHTVGYHYEGGFTSAAVTPEFGGVGCECCHGPGAQHVEDNETRSIERGGEEGCLECHTELRSPAFNYKEYFRRIAHPED
ncbi:MAG TPA: hypothetical protein DCM87_11485 [Planctomycetes bacterium]|nr:hypothetical protein [Planctomycetota bacterium]